MKKIITFSIIAFFGTLWCYPQSSDSSNTEPWTGCKADFSYYHNDSIMTLVEAYPYNFIDLSAGNVVTRNWDFGDGSISHEKNPLHFYSRDGDTVLVCLSIITADGCESSYCTRFIVGDQVSPPHCKTDFTVVILESYPPIYRFIPQGMDSLDTYLWNFGDGYYSNEISPDHRYEFGGNYMVCLCLTTRYGCSASTCDTLEAIGYNKECKAAWQLYPLTYIDSTGTDTTYTPDERYFCFQDQSKGSIISWNWDFGDGTESNVQNPRHLFDQNGIYNVCLEIKTADSCKSSYCDSLFVGVVPYCSLTGTVKDYSGLDGCGLLIVLDNGEVLEPMGIASNFVLKNGQRVRLSYTELLVDPVSICMAGKIVRIDCIEEINMDSCMAAFTHGPLTLVSSPPPIYQFTDLSSGEVVYRLWDLGDGTVTTDISPAHRYEFSGYYTVSLTIHTADSCTSSSYETSFYEGANPQPGLCNNYIRLSTDIILNGQTCNGSATASLVDIGGHEIYTESYLWSTGQTSPVIHDLCPGMTYSVIIADSSGCAVSGSFSFGGGAAYPDSLFGNWNFEQDDKRFIFNLPVFSDSIYCEWDFGDGSAAGGSSVSHTYGSEDKYTVLLNIYDLNGNLRYNQEIIVSPGAPTGIKKPTKAKPEVYPVPVTNMLWVKTGITADELVRIEILTSSGQIIITDNAVKQDNNVYQLDVSELPAGFYLGKLLYHSGTMLSFRFVK